MTSTTRLDRRQAVLVVIDMQEKLLPVLDEHDAMIENVVRLVRGCHILGVPVVVTEQYAKGLGPTVEPIRTALEETGGYRPIEKSCFSAAGCELFAAQLAALERTQVLLTGAEAHVCVYQTAADLLAGGARVSVVADAVSSRTPRNREIALRRLESEGATVTSTEMALFELTVAGGTDQFRAISRLVR